MLTGGTEQTGEGNVDWRNRFMYNKKERSVVLLPVLQILLLPPPPH